MLGGEYEIAALEYVDYVGESVVELFVDEFVAGFLTGGFGFGCEKFLLAVGGVEPVLLDGTGELVLLVLEFELGVGLLEEGFGFGGLGLAGVPDGYAEVDGRAHVEVALELLGNGVVAACVVAVADACADADGGVVAAACYVVLKLGAFDVELGVFDLWTGGEGFGVDAAGCGYGGHDGFVVQWGFGYVKLGVEVELEEVLELSLVVAEGGLVVDDVVFGTFPLGLELDDVGFGHLSLALHFFTAFVLLTGCGGELFGDFDAFACVEYLYVELGYLFLDAELAGLGGEAVLLVGEALGFDLFVVDAAVPYGPVHADAVRAVAAEFLAFVEDLTFAYAYARSVVEGAVGDAV